MTRKHFKAIAEILRSEIEFAKKDRHCYNCRERLRNVTNELADFCATQNPLFDRAKFLEACGIE